MAAMRAILAAESFEGLRATLARAEGLWGVQPIAPLAARLDARAFAAVRGTAAAVDHAAHDASPDAALARFAESFDRVAAVSPEAGAALYSLGDPALLAEATAEVVAWLKTSGLFRAGDRVLEVGCGSGRFLQALEPEAGLVVGVELSPALARYAALQLRGRKKALVARGSGHDLAFLAGRNFDLVLFADSFPYLVQAGGATAGRHLADAAGLLRPGGRVAVLNACYGKELEAETQLVCDLARPVGLAMAAPPSCPFSRWDARSFTLEAALPE